MPSGIGFMLIFFPLRINIIDPIFIKLHLIIKFLIYNLVNNTFIIKYYRRRAFRNIYLSMLINEILFEILLEF